MNLGCDLLGVDAVGQFEVAFEFAVVAFLSEDLSLLVEVGRGALPSQVEFVFVNADFEVVRGDQTWAVPRLEGINYRLLRRFEAAFRRSVSGGSSVSLDRERILSELLRYVEETNRPLEPFEGLRILRLDWDLLTGNHEAKVVETYLRLD